MAPLQMIPWFRRALPPAEPPEVAPTDRAQLGIHARRLLDDPVLTLALAKIEDELIKRWRSTPVGEKKGREAIYRLHWAVQELRAELRAMVGNGKVIEAEAKAREAARLN